MQIPAVGFLEMTLDTMKTFTQAEWDAVERERHEFLMLGDARLETLRQLMPGATVEECAYLFGLEVARTLLSTMPAAVAAGVSL